MVAWVVKLENTLPYNEAITLLLARHEIEFRKEAAIARTCKDRIVASIAISKHSITHYLRWAMVPILPTMPCDPKR